MDTITVTRDQLHQIAIAGATMAGPYARGDIQNEQHRDRMIDRVLAEGGQD